MEKHLFENLDHHSRIQKLSNGCDKVVDHVYFKRFEKDELVQTKDDLSEALIKIDSLEMELADLKAEYKERLDPLKKEGKELLSLIKSKGEMVTEECYVMYDYDEKQAGVYNRMGELVELRPLKGDEYQKTIKLNGTNDR